ncbi:uncharacterized protein LOC126797769 isoform X2 [Argentina anserina]|uniref:uncharacterized protein LOC126797769 isoform X2 n=1 Tax=Argentina anserina TaxID=57926 RepID=UPI00217663C9|nr:uncharacterized protein LOC126797769 isoform X2 [Potentilla anserina]
MPLLTKAGALLRQTANRQSIYHAIRCTSSIGTQEASKGKPFVDIDTRLGVYTSSAIHTLAGQEFHGPQVRLNSAAGLGFGHNSIIGSHQNFGVGPRRSFSSGATVNTAVGKSGANTADGQSMLGKIAARYLPIVTVFPHINAGIGSILADYVHHKLTREFLHLCFDLFILIVAKNLFLALVF